jgi:hypothetical protein
MNNRPRQRAWVPQMPFFDNPLGFLAAHGIVGVTINHWLVR